MRLHAALGCFRSGVCVDVSSACFDKGTMQHKLRDQTKHPLLLRIGFFASTSKLDSSTEFRTLGGSYTRWNQMESDGIRWNQWSFCEEGMAL